MNMEMPPHSIERTRNRHSRALLRDGAIVIRLARGLSAREEQAHITNLLRRMIRVTARESVRTTIDPFRPLLDGRTYELTLALSTGTTVTFRLTADKRSKAKRTTDGWQVAVEPTLRRRTLHHFFWKLLSDSASPELSQLVQEVNRKVLNVPIGKIRTRYMSSQWGSCSTHGTITLNTALLFLPAEILHYVIIHELTHRLHGNHSRRFWNTVESAFPGSSAARKLLRSFRLPTL